jgi:hypothetical protein
MGTAKMTAVGVGYSENPQSWEAGAEAARAALEQAGLSACDLAILYSTEKHDPTQLRNGVRSAIGPSARLIGGYAVGIITGDRLGYEGHQVGVAVLASDSMQIEMFIELGLPDNERAVGSALGRQIAAQDYRGTPNLLLMYDSVKRSAAEGLALNMATPFIEGLSETLVTWPPAAGVGMTGSMQWNPTAQWFDERIEQNSAMALVLAGGVQMDSVIMHGCKPSGAYLTITKADGNTILEIDGRPALEVVGEVLGAQSDQTWAEYPLFVTLGLNKGDKFGEFKEQDYANRLCMAIDKDRRALIMFEPDLVAGSEVRLMRRSIDFEYIGTRAKQLYDGLTDRKPFLAIYIDCAARAAAYCGTEGEEAEEVQRAIGSRIPLLGMYSGVEIAKVGAHMQALDWTGVLCIFSE